MAYFNTTDYTDFFTDYSLKDGDLVDENKINYPTLRLKKEINNVYNVLNILNGNDIIPWRNVENYVTGELVQNKGFDENYYRARKNSNNKRPDLFPAFWTEVLGSDLTTIGNFDDYLNTSNTKPYTPILDYNPATKKYVDDELLKYMNIGELTGDWNYFVKRGTYLALPGLTNAPSTSGKFVVIIGGNTSIYTQFATDILTQKFYFRSYNSIAWTVWHQLPSTLNDNSFTGTNSFANTNTNTAHITNGTIDTLNTTTAAISNLSVANDTVINGNLIVNGATTTLNSTELTVDDKNLVLGSISNPSDSTANGGGLIIKSLIDKSMLYDMITNTFVFSNNITTNLKGNADTASKWKTPRTLTLSGDISGSVVIDGSSNTTMSVAVADNSHTHDSSYYTKTFSDSRYLRKDTSGTLNGSLLITQNLTVNGLIYGTAQKAKYADLAEIYTCEEKLPVGTILTIPKDEKYQVKVCEKNEVPFGVVSEKPGFLLNSSEIGLPVALIGQTPVRIIGTVEKGDPITISDNGVGIKCNYNIPKHLIIGRALETSNIEEEKLVKLAVSI